MSSKDYKLMKESQDFFKAAIQIIIDDKDLDKLKTLVSSYVAAHPNIQTKELLEEFQSEGRALLHIACGNASLAIASYILDIVSPDLVNKPDIKGATPLIHATIAESAEIMELLLSRGANVNALNTDRAGCVHFAASDGSVPRLDILCNAGADLSIQSGAGTPLHWAAGKGKHQVVKYLIQKGVDIDAGALPAVVMAAAAYDSESVCALLEAGANIDHILSGRLTLLHLCAENGLMPAVRLIMASDIGSKLNAVQTDDGNFPVHLAAMSKNREIVEFLLPLTESIVQSGQDSEALMEEGSRRLEHWHSLQQQTQQESHPVEAASPPANEEDMAKAEEHKQNGNTLFKEKKYVEAIAEYTAAIRLDGNAAALWSNRSACYMSMKEHQKALADAEICRRLDPTWVKGCYRLAAARMALGMFEDAAVAAFEGCKLDDKNEDLKALLKEAVRLGQEEHKRKNKNRS